MIKCFYPREYVDSTYQIDFKQLYQDGYRGIIFDVDNTLVPHDAPIDERAKKLFDRLKELGFQTCLISNNKEERVKTFAKPIGAFYVYKAKKPNPKSYRKGMELMHTNERNTVFVGDQIFTDVYGANLAGIYSILVKPIHPKEEIQIVLKRYLEKIVLFFYLRQKSNRKERKKS